MTSLSNILRPILRGSVCIVGVGNRLRVDAAVGPMVLDALRGNCTFPCIDAGVAPENYLEKIATHHPDTVLLVDAVDFRGEPGEIRVFRPDDSSGGLSTHALSLELAAQYLANRCGAETWLVGIQPAQVAMEADVTAEVKEAVRRLVEALGGAAQSRPGHAIGCDCDKDRDHDEGRPISNF